MYRLLKYLRHHQNKTRSPIESIPQKTIKRLRTSVYPKNTAVTTHHVLLGKLHHLSFLSNRRTRHATSHASKKMTNANTAALYASASAKSKRESASTVRVPPHKGQYKCKNSLKKHPSINFIGKNSTLRKKGESKKRVGTATWIPI